MESFQISEWRKVMYDLIIIGSGPAGLSAAVYGKRAGLDLVVLEKNPMSGGQVLNTYVPQSFEASTFTC